MCVNYEPFTPQDFMHKMCRLFLGEIPQKRTKLTA